ncbi:hypothetical protein QF004_002725 [Chryseobacterium sp. MDT2-18]|nr:hypothetical protein [Chryseobacterium sp. MDT2-18]
MKISYGNRSLCSLRSAHSLPWSGVIPLAEGRGGFAAGKINWDVGCWILSAPLSDR